MIKKQAQGDIFKSEHQHVAFAVNTEGVNDAGFAGLVARRHWPDLVLTGPQTIGAVLRKSKAGKTYHAIVCHSLSAGGWKEAPKAIQNGLDTIETKDGETIGVVLMGAGPIGLMQGADVNAILEAMRASKNEVTVYSL